jgi:glycosyltransferase involved in cell wall biosynthesis
VTPSDADVSVVIPAFDEVDLIATTITRVAAFLDRMTPDWELIVVVDGGPPEVVAAAMSGAGAWARATVLVNDENRGKGYSVRRGVLASRGRRVAFLDADLAQPIEQLPALLGALDEGADVAIGARDVGPASSATRLRRLGSVWFSRLARLALDLPFRDTQCGMKAFAGSVSRDLFAAQRLDRFAFDAEVLFLARQWGLRVAEVPVIVVPQSTSTVRLARDAVQMLMELARVRWNALRGVYPARPRQ